MKNSKYFKFVNVAAYRATSAHANQISENRLLKRITDWTDRPKYYKMFTIYTPKYTKAHCDQTKTHWSKPIVYEPKLEVQNIIKL